MAKKSPFDFDIRVSSDKKRRKTGRKNVSGASELSNRICDYPECRLKGAFRAPRSPNDLDNFFWFCKNHIRDYNLKWNFFHGSTDEEFQKFVNKDRVWGRATKPFSQKDDGHAWERLGISDPMDLLGEKAASHSNKRENFVTPSKRKLPSTERKALDILDCHDTMTKAEIRKIYKTLVKDLHPDMNGGDRSDEERLQEVVWAWDQLKDSRYFKE